MEGTMMNPEMKEILKNLMKPFPVSDHSWRVTSTFPDRRNPGKTVGIVAFYISSRNVMNRLDSVVGPANWRADFEPFGGGSVKCTLYVRIGGEWVGKSDVGSGNAEDASNVWKGAVSDALKRAAVHWGIGRYLYNIPKLLVEVDERKRIKNEEEVKSFLHKYVTELLKNYQ
jgi:hypothetical protein